MEIISYSDARARLRPRAPKVPPPPPIAAITAPERQAIPGARAIDWTAIQEALHLLSTPANVERLRAAIAKLDAG